MLWTEFRVQLKVYWTRSRVLIWIYENQSEDKRQYESGSWKMRRWGASGGCHRLRKGGKGVAPSSSTEFAFPLSFVLCCGSFPPSLLTNWGIFWVDTAWEVGLMTVDYWFLVIDSSSLIPGRLFLDLDLNLGFDFGIWIWNFGSRLSSQGEHVQIGNQPRPNNQLINGSPPDHKTGYPVIEYRNRFLSKVGNVGK